MRLRPLTLLFASLLVCAGPALADDIPRAAPPDSLEPLLSGLTSDRLFRTSKVGLQVVDVATGEEVFSWQPDLAMSPASTMKVITAAVALRHLGPSYTFATEVFTDGTLDGAGTLKGDLYVKGSGDPHLVVERLWKLIHDIKLAGIEAVEGDIVFDDTLMDTDPRLPGWTKQRDIERGPSYFSTLGALSLNFNTAAVVVAPGPEPGAPARVVLETPASRYVTVQSDLTTGAARSRRWVDLSRKVEATGMRFELSGVVPVDAKPAKYYRTIADPTAHFMAAWADMMTSHGITHTGALRRGEVPEETERVAVTVSPPLSAILMDMNKYSNNFMAEQVLRTVGAEVKGAPGTNAKGLEVVDDYLTSLGVDAAAYRLVNGSGLSREIRLQPSMLTAVLVDMAHDPRVGGEFLSSLSIAGLDGTLSRRLEEDPGRMRGKTGTIDGVHCLAGYLDAPSGARYAFAFMVNDLSGGAYQARRVHDRFARELLGSNSEDGVVERGTDD